MELTGLLQQISTAFERVPHSKVSLRQLWLTDTKGMAGTITKDEWSAAGSMRSDRKWNDITSAEIEQYGCQLAHTQAPEYIYYLPAYMAYGASHVGEESVGNDILGTTLFMLTPSFEVPAYSAVQYRLLSESHRRAIAAFLQYVGEHGNEYGREDAVRALQHWA